MKTIIDWVVTIVLLAMIAEGGLRAYKQHIRLARIMETEAEIVSSQPKYYKPRADKRYIKDGYYPSITFKYNVKGINYESDWYYSIDDTPPLKESELQVKNFLRDYPPGKKVKAYYRLDKPQEAFLFTRRSYNPFRYILLISIITCVFIYNRKSENDKHGFYMCLVSCVLWLLAGVICYGYYFNYADKPYKTGVIIRCIVYFILGIFWLYNLFKPVLFGSFNNSEPPLIAKKD